MKKTRKLIPALAMLLISAVMMSTASFAWFSMNKQVTATGMQITAQSDNVWLVINTDTGAGFDSSNTINEATSAGAASLYPVAPATTLTAANVTTPESWHFAYSNATNSHEAAGGYQECANLTNYVASETFYIGLSDISGATEAPNLRLIGVTLPENTGISVVVVCGTNIFEHKATANNLNETLAAKATKDGTAVTVYYYINGEDDNVYTDNIAALTGKVVLTFDVGYIAP